MYTSSKDVFKNHLNDIEDLAITIRFLRESDAKKAEDGDVVLSTTFPMD